jgi:hypothetical protein
MEDFSSMRKPGKLPSRAKDAADARIPDFKNWPGWDGERIIAGKPN